MKNLIIIIAVFLAASVCYSQTFNASVPASSTLKTTVIHPFSITNVQADPNSGGTHLPDVISGQTRNLTAVQGGMYIFKVSKEKGKNVAFSYTGANTVNGLTITGNWYWTYGLPSAAEPGSWTALPANWTWGVGSDEMDPAVNGLVTVYAFLKINSIADDGTQGPRKVTFTVNAQGAYVGL